MVTGRRVIDNAVLYDVRFGEGGAVATNLPRESLVPYPFGFGQQRLWRGGDLLPSLGVEGTRAEGKTLPDDAALSCRGRERWLCELGGVPEPLESHGQAPPWVQSLCSPIPVHGTVEQPKAPEVTGDDTREPRGAADERASGDIWTAPWRCAACSA